MGEVTDKANETRGHSQTHNFGLDEPVEETRVGSEVAGSSGKAESEADSAKLWIRSRFH
jgi:hypothetical protein